MLGRQDGELSVADADGGGVESQTEAKCPRLCVLPEDAQTFLVIAGPGPEGCGRVLFVFVTKKTSLLHIPTLSS